MEYRLNYRGSGHGDVYAWDDGSRPSQFSPWPGLKFATLNLLAFFGFVSRAIDPWVLTAGICFALYLNDRWETAINRRKFCPVAQK